MNDPQTRLLARRALKSVLFFLGLGVVFAVCYRLGAPHYCQNERAKIRSLIDAPQTVDALVWGSSHGKCIRLGLMGFNGENLSVDAQDLFETSYSAHALVPELTHLKVVFIAMSYFSLLYDNGQYEKNGVNTRAAIRVNMYARYPRLYWPMTGDLSSFIKGMLYPIVTTDHWERVFKNPAKKPFRHASRERKNLKVGNTKSVLSRLEKEGGSQTMESLTKHSTPRCDSYVPLIENMLSHHPTVVEDSYQTTRDLVDYLHRRRIRVVFFTPPYYASYNRRFKREWIDLMHDRMRRLARETKVEYYDFSRDLEFEIAPKMFTNSDHLNDIGGELFSLRLKQRMHLRNTRGSQSRKRTSGKRNKRWRVGATHSQATTQWVKRMKRI